MKPVIFVVVATIASMGVFLLFDWIGIAQPWWVLTATSVLAVLLTFRVLKAYPGKISQ